MSSEAIFFTRSRVVSEGCSKPHAGDDAASARINLLHSWAHPTSPFPEEVEICWMTLESEGACNKTSDSKSSNSLLTNPLSVNRRSKSRVGLCGIKIRSL